MVTDILKLQRSLFSSDDKSRVLIYNQSRTVMFVMGLTPELDQLFNGREKIFATGTVDPSGQINLEETEYQNW